MKITSYFRVTTWRSLTNQNRQREYHHYSRFPYSHPHLNKCEGGVSKHVISCMYAASVMGLLSNNSCFCDETGRTQLQNGSPYSYITALNSHIGCLNSGDLLQIGEVIHQWQWNNSHINLIMHLSNCNGICIGGVCISS